MQQSFLKSNSLLFCRRKRRDGVIEGPAPVEIRDVNAPDHGGDGGDGGGCGLGIRDAAADATDDRPGAAAFTSDWRRY